MNPTYMNSHYSYIEDIFHPRHNLQELNEILLLLLLLQNPHTLLYRGHKSTSLHFCSYIWGKIPTAIVWDKGLRLHLVYNNSNTSS